MGCFRLKYISVSPNVFALNSVSVNKMRILQRDNISPKPEFEEKSKTNNHDSSVAKKR